MEISDYIREGNTRIMGVPEGEERKNGTESLFGQDKNFPHLGQKLDIKYKKLTKYLNAKRPSPGHIILTLTKVNNKEEFSKP